MSEIFEQYEVEFKELADGLAGKVAAVGSLSGELRAGKVAEVEGEVAEGEALLRRMELEARSLAGGAKAPLLARVKEHRAGLAKVKADVRARASGASAGDAARAELGLDGAGGGGGGGFASSSATQRERLLTTTDRLNQSSDRIRQGRQTLLQTEELGTSILADLHRQRQTITHARDTLHTADDNIGRARKALNSLGRWFW
mmetsp:Transcript_876/g.2228  ORF Transcript_876/g.2228 Transcript_876/m.2228 type:complete len:201 (-) Transcript_876:355-957(-)|eukprot:jgi/Tetstr1/436979/TSEL_025751.t1